MEREGVDHQLERRSTSERRTPGKESPHGGKGRPAQHETRPGLPRHRRSRARARLENGRKLRRSLQEVGELVDNHEAIERE
jgi:hypothetical protein